MAWQHSDSERAKRYAAKRRLERQKRREQRMMQARKLLGLPDVPVTILTPKKLASKKTSPATPRRSWKGDKQLSEFGSKAHKYGLSHAQFAELLAAQNNKCAICGCKFSLKNRPCIDHDHKTDKARGLLCSPCNTGISCFRDNLSFIVRAYRYLERPPVSRFLEYPSLPRGELTASLNDVIRHLPRGARTGSDL